MLTSIRSRELLRAGAQLGSAEADILFLRARQGGGQGGLFYNEFVQLCIDVCDRAAGRGGAAARRPEQRAAADAGEDQPPGLDEQMRGLLSRMAPPAAVGA